MTSRLNIFPNWWKVPMILFVLAVASKFVFATIAINIAILLANLLLTSMRRAMPFSACTLTKKTTFFLTLTLW